MAEYEPLFLVADLFVEGALADRTWYFYNFEAKRGCMFDRARTTLSLAADRGIAVVGNTGSVPAMGVAVTRPGHADTFTPEEGFLWLDPGETRRIAVDSTDGLDVEALNAGGTR
jgi:beta-mannosidase